VKKEKTHAHAKKNSASDVSVFCCLMLALLKCAAAACTGYQAVFCVYCLFVDVIMQHCMDQMFI